MPRNKSHTSNVNNKLSKDNTNNKSTSENNKSNTNKFENTHAEVPDDEKRSGPGGE
ncbi:MAG TPA: hypothetical protein GXZ90_02955 [Clostridiales bacterium]|nr:hypothetical protein [Clostridiales bacterium]